jgi:hypothetical protein
MEQNQAKLSIIKYWNKLQHKQFKIDFGGLKAIPIWNCIWKWCQSNHWRKYLKNRELFGKWIAEYGADKIILGADANNEK